MPTKTKLWLTLSLSLLMTSHTSNFAVAETDSRLFELRVYDVEPGKQSEIISFMEGVGSKLMSKHNITLEGAWIPVDNQDQRVFSLVSHTDKATGDAAWGEFRNDPDLQAAIAAASTNGPAVKSIERIFLKTNDYSPKLKSEKIGNRVFELRTYASTPGNLTALNNRFRNHTLDLFTKHGITNIVYWSASSEAPYNASKLLSILSSPTSPAAELDAQTNASEVALVYFVAHASPEAAKGSFGTFGQDPAWIKAKSDSEAAAGGPLTVKNGVKSLFLKSLDFSPLQ